MPPGRRHPYLILLFAAATVVASLAVCAAAVLVPAPPAAVPVVALLSVGAPMFASWEIPGAIASLRTHREHRAVALLRQSLDQLPEVEHPLGM